MIPEIPHLSKRSMDQIVVRISVVSSENTMAKLYYSIGRNKNFSETTRLKHRILAGFNMIYFILPKEFNGGWLRFDPGELEGLYTINKVEGRVIDSESINNFL